MFARMTKFRIKIDKIETAIRLYNESVVPSAKAQKGFCRLSLLVNRETGEGTSITFWDSEEDAKANEENRYYQNQLIKFLNFLEKPTFIREGYEVATDV
jgi:heme-degrading monooxygenase HmoA